MTSKQHFLYATASVAAAGIVMAQLILLPTTNLHYQGVQRVILTAAAMLFAASAAIAFGNGLRRREAEQPSPRAIRSRAGIAVVAHALGLRVRHVNRNKVVFTNRFDQKRASLVALAASELPRIPGQQSFLEDAAAELAEQEGADPVAYVDAIRAEAQQLRERHANAIDAVAAALAHGQLIRRRRLAAIVAAADHTAVGVRSGD
ncbi:MAG: hypothetical protein ACTH0V_00490 [Microbacteriaceae bacterium]